MLVAPPARRLEAADLVWATELLAIACADQPVLRYCCPGPNAAAQRRWLLGQLLRYGLRYGRMYTNASHTAIAVWLGPEQPGSSWWRQLRSGLLPGALWRLEWKSWQRLNHFLETAAWLRRQSMGPASHFYLLALTVHPADQGHGQGRRLLQATMAAMQAAHSPCYLHTQVPEQLSFFQRLGFRLMGQCPTDAGLDSPTTWGLLRTG